MATKWHHLSTVIGCSSETDEAFRYDVLPDEEAGQVREIEKGRRRALETLERILPSETDLEESKGNGNAGDAHRWRDIIEG